MQGIPLSHKEGDADMGGNVKQMMSDMTIPDVCHSSHPRQSIATSGAQFWDTGYWDKRVGCFFCS